MPVEVLGRTEGSESCLVLMAHPLLLLQRRLRPAFFFFFRVLAGWECL